MHDLESGALIVCWDLFYLVSAVFLSSDLRKYPCIVHPEPQNDQDHSLMERLLPILTQSQD